MGVGTIPTIVSVLGNIVVLAFLIISVLIYKRKSLPPKTVEKSTTKNVLVEFLPIIMNPGQE